MASVGTVTVDVVVGENLEAAIRKIVREEIVTTAESAASRDRGCSVEGCSVEVTLLMLANEARYRAHDV